MCDPHDGNWRLGKDHVVQEVSLTHGDHEIVNLAWSHSGNDLAIIDISGQISIYNIYISINRLVISRRCVLDPEDNLSAVVGLMWLHNDRQVCTSSSRGYHVRTTDAIAVSLY